jgi:calcium-dependent protein kinase
VRPFLRELGKGQFGTTYMVTNKHTGQQAACKAIAKRKLQAKDDIDDVRREVFLSDPWILYPLNEH